MISWLGNLTNFPSYAIRISHKWKGFMSSKNALIWRLLLNSSVLFLFGTLTTWVPLTRAKLQAMKICCFVGMSDSNISKKQEIKCMYYPKLRVHFIPFSSMLPRWARWGDKRRYNHWSISGTCIHGSTSSTTSYSRRSLRSSNNRLNWTDCFVSFISKHLFSE